MEKKKQKYLVLHAFGVELSGIGGFQGRVKKNFAKGAVEVAASFEFKTVKEGGAKRRIRR